MRGLRIHENISLLQFSDRSLLSSLFSLFPWSQFHSLYEECRLNWLCKAKAGRQAEGWSIKLVNHFLFSLRTAVDW